MYAQVFERRRRKMQITNRYISEVNNELFEFTQPSIVKMKLSMQMTLK
jgi:hypothetical protein